MARRTRAPETKTLHISQGDWLLVQKHLTAGQEREIFRGMLREGAKGDTIDSVKVGMSRIVGYLLDWSFTDHNDKPIVIRDKSPDVVVDALNAITPEAFAEVLQAIDAHAAEMEKEREAEKNAPATASASSPTSPSPEPLAGVTTG
jgi:hypothetical protein